MAEQIPGLGFIDWVSEQGSRVYGLDELNHGFWDLEVRTADSSFTREGLAENALGFGIGL